MKQNLRIKMVTLFVTIVLVAMLVLLVLNYYITINGQYNQFIDYNQNIVETESHLLSNILKQVSDTSLIPYSNSELYELLTSKVNDIGDNDKIKVCLQNILSTSKSINRVRLYSSIRNTEYIATSAGSFMNVATDESALKLPFNSIEISAVTDKVSKLFFEHSHDKTELNVVRSLYTIPGKNYLGYIELSIDLSYVFNISQSNEFKKSLVSLIVGNENIVMENPNDYNPKLIDSNLQNITNGEAFISDASYIFLSHKIPFKQSKDAIYLVKVISNASIRELAIKLASKSSLIGLVVIGLSILIIANLASKFTKPFSYIEEQLQKISKGNLNVRMDIKTEDEFGLFAQHFNNMIKAVNDVIISDYKLQISNKNNQLKALQAQLNPHFINNTLQNIGAEALKTNNLPLYTSVVKFGRMMQYTMNFVSMNVQFKDELEYTLNYMDLQQMRFGGRFISKIDVSDEAKSVTVPKLLLQPLVENIFKHGVSNSTSVITIEIIAFVDSNKMYITCKNDGRGISQEELENLRAVIERFKEEDEESMHIGLRNLSRRLNLIYGDAATINLDSENEKGFEIDIEIPVGEYEFINR